MNEEILSGLKGAVERGFKLDESARSFINSGHNPAEVKEAVSLISKGFSPLPTALKAESMSNESVSEQKSTSKIKPILIILTILIIISVVISLILFRTQFLGAVIDPFFP